MVVGGPTGETGLNSNCGIQVGILRTQDARCSACGREAGDILPLQTLHLLLGQGNLSLRLPRLAGPGERVLDVYDLGVRSRPTAVVTTTLTGEGRL